MGFKITPPDKTLDELIEPAYGEIMMNYLSRSSSILDLINREEWTQLTKQVNRKEQIDLLWDEIYALQDERDAKIKAWREKNENRTNQG